MQVCGGRELITDSFSSFTIASLEVPLGASWTVNQASRRTRCCYPEPHGGWNIKLDARYSMVSDCLDISVTLGSQRQHLT